MDTLEKATYEADFVRWLDYQAELLRAGRVQELDLENLAEEIESIARSDKREIYNRLTVLLAHLLKYQFQPAKRSRSWLSTISEQRRRLRLILEDSPSLAKNYAPDAFGDIYQDARKAASSETRIAVTAFPESCPYTLEQTLSEDFLPEG